ncbi:PucR family transcriptional regulator [Streptomyces sp. URMC 123]|uniref:PucR family transcriptional regulator n=1 Tax=Streptomyces sp. URMC 123 TaxID=3423403 RepID=UPI003F1DDBC2
MEPRAGITVRRALELPALRRGLPEVVARGDRLDREVRWVHAGEAPNIAALLKGGELLLTTGIGIGDRAADQRAFVRRLAQRGIAALVVELGTRFTELPRALVESADVCGLPLVQLHHEVPFVAVTEEIHTEIVNGHYAMLRSAEDVHRRCTDTLLRGGGAPEVLGLLADFAGNPVFLETADGRLLYAAGGPAAGEALRVWEGLRGPRAGRRTAAAPKSADSTAGTAPGGVPGGAPGGAAGGVTECVAGGVAVDVPGGGPGPGAVRARLVVLPVDTALAPVHRMAAERTAGLLAVVLMQARQEEELAARGRGDFLTDLAEGRVDAAAAPARAAALGFRPPGELLLPLVMRLPAELIPPGDWAVLVRAAQEELVAVGLPVLLGVRPVEGRVPLLVGLRAEADREQVADRVAAALRAGLDRAGLARADARQPAVVAGVAGGWARTGPGLRHAAEAAAAAQVLPPRPWYDARRLDIDLLLWRLREHPDLAAFVDRALGPLLAHDRSARPPLVPTLEAYLAHAGRKAETARELHLNRQTLYDRLARISHLLAADLDDPQTVLALNLALHARRHVS